MEHLVYISYSTKDAEVTKKIVKYIENAGIKCWMAPRDILPGIDWAKSIIDGIVNSKLMLLIFSKNSNESPQVLREVERAVNRQIPIMPFRIEETPMSGSMEYFISSHHWFDAFDNPLDTYLDDLAVKIGRVLDIPVKLPTGEVVHKEESVEAPKVESVVSSGVFEKNEPVIKEEPKKETPKPIVQPTVQKGQVSQAPLVLEKKSNKGLFIGISVAAFVLIVAAAFWFIKPLHEMIFPSDKKTEETNLTNNNNNNLKNNKNLVLGVAQAKRSKANAVDSRKKKYVDLSNSKAVR
ncbi:MAG: toll/interleukin-1 receptor domain-containing protein [Ignavibacteriales bacterium]|nr:toll/interleukin-1 receptor domain-containing protein [Ignavibacteriales bacterium]